MHLVQPSWDVHVKPGGVPSGHTMLLLRSVGAHVVQSSFVVVAHVAQFGLSEPVQVPVPSKQCAVSDAHVVQSFACVGLHVSHVGSFALQFSDAAVGSFMQ